MERLSSRFQVTGSDDAKGQFTGMASVFGSMVDAYMPTIIEPGAFTKTLIERADRVKVLWQHMPEYPIGKPILLEERPAGLYVQAQISQTTLGKDAMILMRDGVVDELSIGFDPVKFDFETVDGKEIRHIRELRLWEFSPVTFAADPMARITEANRRDQREPLDVMLSALSQLQESHAGKVLSAKNKTLVQEAVAALQALLAAAEPPVSDDAQALTRHVDALLRTLELDALTLSVGLR